MLMGRFLIGLVLGLFLLISSVYAQVIYNAPAKVRWDPSETVGVDRYALTMIRDGTGESWTYGTSNLEYQLPRPKSGVFTIEVRAGMVDTDQVLRWSDPCSSLGPTAKLKDGTTGAWKIRWKPPAPVGPIIIGPKP